MRQSDHLIRKRLNFVPVKRSVLYKNYPSIPKFRHRALTAFSTAC